MTLENRIASAFGLDDAGWARHANPWSGWSRIIDDHAWTTKCVLGERFWSNRREVPVPKRHRTIPNILHVASLAGFPFLIWGLVTFQPWPTALGAVLITGAKLLYIDRMAVLYDDMADADPRLRYRGPGSDTP